MKTPSPYPILDNRPIDQWKVTELKEELKKRKLTIGGLKQDLIKRLDEAIRAEKEAPEAENDNGVEEHDAEIVTEAAAEKDEAVSDAGEAGIVIPDDAQQTVDGADDKIMEADDVSAPVDNEESAQQQVKDMNIAKENLNSVTDNDSGVDVVTATDIPSGTTEDKVCGGFSSDAEIAGQGLHDDKMEGATEDSKAQQDYEDVKHDDVKLDSSDTNNQVSEISTNLGFPIKSNSISTDSVSISENHNIVENIITDNSKLEPDVIPEMVQPSSSNLAPDDGLSHPMDVEEPHENKVSVDSTDNNNTNADMSQKSHSADLGSPEKLNLDRSSGDDSMEEDALESKQIDSNCNSEEVGEKPEKSEVITIKEESLSAITDTDLPKEDESIHIENKDAMSASFEKRKLQDQEAVLNNEPSKRQHRWKSENANFSEPQMSKNIPTVSSKDVTPSLQRNLSASNSVGDASKESQVPQSAKAPTSSLRIDRFLRPFTLKAVQELLAKTGTVTSFWMDHIKTHCYVTYSSVEEAVETRNAVYNLQWPPNGGRNLIADFVDPQEVKMRLQAPPPQPLAAPASTAPEPPTLSQPSPRPQNVRQQMPQPTLPPPPPLSNPDQIRERAHPPSLPFQEKIEAPIVTLDDLFRKTKATPRIYYLPLSEEQVLAKQEVRRKNL